MSTTLDLLARLLAYRDGRAQPRASHRQVTIHPQARVLCPLALAGEDTTIHIVAYGPIGGPPRVLCVPDPRKRDPQFDLFARLGANLERWFERCRREGAYPQLWVSSGAAASHLDVLADRLRYNRLRPEVKRFGELLSYATGRLPVAGQQALLTATGALTRHWATGQQPGEDEHLGAVLAWIDPPAGVPVLEAVAAAEFEPMGAKTDPVFDERTLEPLVRAYDTAARAGATAAVLDGHAANIQAVLEPIVLRIYAATQRAIALLQAAGLPLLPDLPELEAREAAEFENFMQGRDENRPLTLRDGAKAAAFGLATREEALQNVGAAVLLGDRVARAAGRLTGRVVVGIVESPRSMRAGPYRVVHRFELVSRQRVLHVRVRDELYRADDGRLRVLVEQVRRRGTETRLTLRILAGQRAVGLPAKGAELEFVEGMPAWGEIWRVRGHLKTTLATRPWTHTPGALPAASPPPKTPPADPLALVEALR
jgi:hypothetical protein